jgi:hypothetical protein
MQQFCTRCAVVIKLVYKQFISNGFAAYAAKVKRVIQFDWLMQDLNTTKNQKSKIMSKSAITAKDTGIT